MFSKLRGESLISLVHTGEITASVGYRHYDADAKSIIIQLSILSNVLMCDFCVILTLAPI